MPRLRTFRLYVPTERHAWFAWRARVAFHQTWEQVMLHKRRIWWYHIDATFEERDKRAYHRRDKPTRIMDGWWLVPFMAVYGYEDTRWAIAHYELQKGQ